MDPIRTAALIIGLIALAKGATGLINPKWLVEWARTHIIRRDNNHLRFYGLAATVVGGFLMYMIWGEVAWLATITVMIVTLVTVKGLLTLFFPEVTRALIRARAALPKAAIRILCLITTILAIYLILFGLRIS